MSAKRTAVDLNCSMLCFSTPFQNLSFHYVVGHQAVEPYTWNIYIYIYIHVCMQFMATFPYHYPYYVMMASICTDQYCILAMTYARARTMGRAMQSSKARFFQAKRIIRLKINWYVYLTLLSLSSRSQFRTFAQH